MIAEHEPCEFCNAPFTAETHDGWGSRFTCGTTVLFIDGTGLHWTRSTECLAHDPAHSDDTLVGTQHARLPLNPLPACDHDLEYVAPSAGHTGTLFRCKKCLGYAMRGEPLWVRN